METAIEKHPMTIKSAPALPPKTKGRRSRAQKRDIRDGYLFLLPNICGFLLFTAFPVVFSLGLSFFNWKILTPAQFVRIDNFKTMFTGDPQFVKSLLNTLEFVVLYLPLNIVISLLLAQALSGALKGVYIYRMLFFLPLLCPMVAVANIWKWIYQPDYGLLNGTLRTLGIAGPNWLGDPGIAMVSVVLMSVWAGMAYNMIIFIAGIKGIPQQLYEAASIDGANGVQRFFRITVPMLSPTLFFNVVMTLITSFQVFDQVFIMTQGGPMNSTKTLVYHIYLNGFQFFNMGYASAMSWVLFAIIFLLTLIQLKMQNKWVIYDI